MQPSYLIERMTQAEVQTAIDWAAKVGWNPGLNDAMCFYQTDPNGFFAGKLNGKIIAVGSAVIYDDHFAFCGLYIVDEAYRHQGYGLALTKARLAYIGQRNAGLDGDLKMTDKYRRLGYRTVHQNIRYRGQSFPSISPHAAIVPLANVHFAEIERYDRLHFPAARSTFLKAWITQSQATSLGYVDQGQLRGYTVLRACRQGFKIGPLFADTPAIAEQLLLQIVPYAQGGEVNLDIPGNNPEAVALVQRLHLQPIFTVDRMYLQGEPSMKVNQIFGITTFELG